MYNLTKKQQDNLVSLRSEVIERAEEMLNAEIRLLMFTFYPFSEQYGCSVIVNDRVYYGSGKTIDSMIQALFRAKTAEIYILPSTTIFERNRV